MLDQRLLEKLAALTGSLRPGEGVAAGELKEARRLAARFLIADTEDPPQAPPPADEPREAAFAAVLDDLAEDEIAELEKALEDGERLRSAVAAGERPAEDMDVRVYRREWPVVTSQAAASTPRWAAGRRIDRTIGPFYDAINRPSWFDFFFPVRQVSVLRAPSLTPVLQIPLLGFVVTSASRYTLPAGSIWILSRALTPTAPADAYTGLRIKGGELSLTAPVSVTAGALTMGPAETATLRIELDPPAPGPMALGPGVDAAESEAKLPSTAIIQLAPAGGRVVEATDAKARVYGSDFRLTHVAGAAEFEPLVNRIMVPFETDAKSLKIGKVKSALFQPSGETEIAGAAWALPVTVATPASLGEAAGAGALALTAKGGLRATWRGLEGPPVRLGTLLMVEPDRLVLVAQESRGPGSSQRFELWDERGGNGRRSAAELSYRQAFTLRFFSERGASELLLLRGVFNASLDRPLCSDGSRLPARGAADVAISHTGSEFNFMAMASPRVSPNPVSLALSNALLTTSTPTRLLCYGRLSASEPSSVESGAALLIFGVALFTPALPDPYAANIEIPAYGQGVNVTGGGQPAQAGSFSALFAVVRWTKPADPGIDLRLLGAPRVSPMAIPSPTGSPSDKTKEDLANLKGLRVQFDEVAGGGHEGFKLLDLSTQADHLGVGLGPSAETLREAGAAAVSAVLGFRGVDWVSAGRNLRVLTTPQIQWEPVITAPNPDGFPTPMASAGDGGPTLIGANSVTLVPVAPRPLLDQIVDEFNQTPSVSAAAMLTLPFGMVATARLEKPATAADKGADLALNQPATADGAYKGGLQLAMRAISPHAGPNHESPGFEGATFQTRNGVDPATLAPLGKSVLSGLPGSAPGTAVEDMFNNEMKPSGGRPRAPVSRIDISGYGASMFSNWRNPNAAVAETSQVRFDVMVGRTAYEVVQVKSVLYPWGVPLVRSITIERRREALVYRKDSGWTAIDAGRYRYPGPTVAVPGGWGAATVAHPGVVLAVHEVRNVRETGRAFNKTIAGEKVILAEVRFDADFEIDGVVSGQNSDGRVIGKDQTGFVQTAPMGLPLSDKGLAQLLAEEGPLGGPVDCVIDVGGSGQTMRVARVDVDAAPSGFGAYEFAAAARGALDLPEDGAWSVLRHDFSQDEPAAVDLDSGTPLIRKGQAGAAPSDWFRFADPADLLTGSGPTAEYALMQSSDAHRVLFPRPRIKKGGAAVEGGERAVLADAYAMAGASGPFPKRDICFASAAPYRLDIRSDGRYKLNPPTIGFPVSPFQEQRDLANAAAFKIFAKYPVGDPSQITFTLDPDAAPSWKVHERKLAIGMDLGPFEALMTVKGDFYIEAGSAAKVLEPEVVYGPALGPVNAVIKLLTEIAKLFGAETPFGFSMTNPKVKMKAAVDINIGLLAKKVFGSSSVDADGYFALWPNGPKVKGVIGAGFSNDPGALSQKLGAPPAPAAPAKTPKWGGYFAVKLGAKIPITLPIFGDGEGRISFIGNELVGYFVEIQLRWGVSASADVGVLKFSGRFYFGVILLAGSNLFGIGILIGVSGSASVLAGMFSITVRFELIGLIETSGGKTEAVGKAVVAAEITVCWFITISFSTEVEVRERISA